MYGNRLGRHQIRIMYSTCFMGDLGCRKRQMRRRFGSLRPRLVITLAIVIGLASVMPLFQVPAAWAQQSGSGGTPVSVDPGVTGPDASNDPQASNGASMSAMSQAPSTTDQTNSQTYQDVYVDGEKHSWRPLESGTQQAWEAYRVGDYQNAVPVFARLAKLGHPVAEWLMGNVYYAGQGVPQDYHMALMWFEKAANQGYMPAYAPTASLYLTGKGTPVDAGKAYLWYNIAIAALPYSVERYGLMKQRDALADQMTPAQIDAAQKRSLAFQPRKVIPPDLDQAREMLGE
jgi:TPR repeat protein